MRRKQKRDPKHAFPQSYCVRIKCKRKWGERERGGRRKGRIQCIAKGKQKEWQKGEWNHSSFTMFFYELCKIAKSLKWNWNNNRFLIRIVGNHCRRWVEKRQGRIKAGDSHTNWNKVR